MKTIFKVEERVTVYRNEDEILSEQIDIGFYTCKRNALKVVKSKIDEKFEKVGDDLYIEGPIPFEGDSRTFVHSYFIREVALNERYSGINLLNTVGVIIGLV